MRARHAWIPVGVLLFAASCAGREPAPVVVVPAATPVASPSAPAPSGPRDKDWKPAPDSVADDPGLPAGTVQVTVVDADGEPIPRAPVSFDTVIVRAPSNGLDVIAKDTAVADEKGTTIFRKVRAGGDHHHVASTHRGDATFAIEPFSLSEKSGKRVTLHAYETVRDLKHALVVLQTLTALHVRADTIDVQVLYRFHNIGRVAWVPVDVRVAFPPNVTGFLASDLGLPVRADQITRAGFALAGTVAPGQHELEFRYQIPRGPRGVQQISLDQPPRVMDARVILEASGAAQLTVAGFPAAKVVTTHGGAPVLMTDRRMGPGEGGLKSLDITLAGDPR